MEEELNIGLSFSGGGYRAATFDLGALSFLNTIRLEDGRTLLDCVSVLSSVSGGTIPAMKYMLAQVRNQAVGDMVEELFDFLCNEDLVTRALREMSAQKANPDASLIKIMAGIYDSCLFGNAKMSDIIDNIDRIRVKDYTALATDFDNSLPFRFRITSGFQTTGERLTYGVFGNNKHNIGRSVVEHITPGEALACSSCFPSGFEPMMYPDDFKVSQIEDIASTITTRFGIMDGGVSDNQGIESVLLAEKRMRRYRDKKAPEGNRRTDPALDLVIISDVASPYMEGYAPSEHLLPKSVGKLTLGRLRNYGLISEAVMITLLIIALVLGNKFWLGVMAVILAIVTLANFAGALLKNKMFSSIARTFIGNNATFISHMKFATIESMLMNRAKSVVEMSSVVFLKRLRQMSYSSIYDDKGWDNRIVTSTIYELRPGEDWQDMDKHNNLPKYLVPSEAMQQNSTLASSMGTTLWFTNEDKEAGMPQAILACGQYTLCYNLLDYIEKIETKQANLTPAHDLIKACKPQLLEAWEKFQANPEWMVPKKK
ncbi:MAG: patatin-like phospholipase family protein [Muribaculaceae bacterium]|nr:patatin-like phospholipase family protein [Muribaculaceae bacterium]